MAKAPWYSMLAAAAFLALSLAGPRASAQSSKTLAPDAHRTAGLGEILLLDVRSEQEWRESGLPQNAVPVTIHQKGGAEAFYRAVLEAAGGDKAKPLALICATGGRSMMAQRFLTAKGFSDVRDVSEGMLGRPGLPGWIKRGLPVEAWEPR